MINNKGFSFKELFMVIIAICVVIFGIMPFIFKSFDSAKDTSITNSIDVFREEVEKVLFDYTMHDGIDIVDGCYELINDGDICLEMSGEECSNVLEVTIEGVTPKSGSIDIKDNHLVNVYNIFIENKYVNFDGEEYLVTDKPKSNLVCEKGY